MRVLDLFSGIGGFSLGLERAGMTTVGFCEIDSYCRKVLALHWPGVKIHEDITKLNGTEYDGSIDLICGGYPCQPFSEAGRKQGEKDPRHLWPEMYRIIREARPRWVIAENVRGHVGLGFDTVAAQLEDEGFTVWPFIVPACAVGAPHRRDRLWIVGHASGERSLPAAQPGVHRQAEGEGARNEELERRGAHVAHSPCELLDRGGSPGEAGRIEPSNCSEFLADSLGDGLQGCSFAPECECEGGPIQPRCEASGISCLNNPNGSWWKTEPDVGRVAHGVPSRVDRLKSLGNAVVPQIPELIGRAIIAYEQQLALAA